MIKERAFRIAEGVGLPPDTEIIIPQPHTGDSTSSNRCSSCASGSCPTSVAAARLNEKISQRFLAVSPSAASYVVFDLDLIEAFRVLVAGAPLRVARDLLRAQFGYDVASQKLQTILRGLVARNFFGDAQREEFVPAHPTLHMYVTNRCNLRCRHCYMSSGLPLSQGEIGTQERLKAIDIFSRQCPGSKVTFTGGEALLDPDIFFLMGHARALGLRVELYSNGLTIKNSAIAEQIVRVVHQLQISLDGATQEINDAIRGKGTFKGIVRGIKLIDAAKNALEAHDFSQRIAITLTSTNAQDVVSNLEALLDDMKLHYRPEVHIGTIGNLGRAKIHADLRSNQEAIRLAQAAIANAFVASGIYRLPLSKINRFSKSCGMGTSISIGADGKIYPCTITDQTAIGDIRDSNAEEIMGSVFDHFHKTSVDNIVGCRSCSIRYFCGGICRITNNGKKGSMYVSACTPAYKAGRVRDLVAKYDGFQIV